MDTCKLPLERVQFSDCLWVVSWTPATTLVLATRRLCGVWRVQRCDLVGL